MAVKDSNHRITATIPEDDYQRVLYWSKKEGLSVNAWLCEAVIEKIKRANGDYDLPTLEQQRLNQLNDNITTLSSDFYAAMDRFDSAMDSLLGLTRGDNYLLKNREDGELE